MSEITKEITKEISNAIGNWAVDDTAIAPQALQILADAILAIVAEHEPCPRGQCRQTRQRARRATQSLIDCLGSVGPESIEDAAARAVRRIDVRYAQVEFDKVARAAQLDGYQQARREMCVGCKHVEQGGAAFNRGYAKCQADVVAWLREHPLVSIQRAVIARLIEERAHRPKEGA